MKNQPSSPELSQLLDIEQRHIHEKYRYVYYLNAAPPNASGPWPKDLRPFAEAELLARLCVPDQPPPLTPYSDYDAWLTDRCGPDGYDRVGSTVGLRDRTAAMAFLRWIFPELADRSSSAEHDMKHHLARMMVKVVPNDEVADDILTTIGEDIVSRLEPELLASLSDRIYRRSEQEDRQELLASESEDLGLKIMGLDPRGKQTTQTK